MKTVRYLVLLGFALTSTALAEPRSESIEALFAVRLVAPATVKDGAVRTHVRVYHPYDRRPLPGVEVRLSLESAPEITSVVTDEDGAAEAWLRLPEGYGSDQVRVQALARHWGRTRHAQTWIYFESGEPRVILGSDKRLYRPGQTLHVRGLWLGADGRPLAGESVKLALEDRRGRFVFVTDLVTSPFGVAATEWRIPPAAEEGDYTIEAGFDPIPWGAVRVGVSRYELPRFRIEKAETLLPYYLSGQDAEVEVVVTTAAGEPLGGAEVVVEARDLRTLEDIAPARTDETGRALLQLPLEEAHSMLAEYGVQFLDHELTLVARDSVSGRSVRAPVGLRVSRWPIHVYPVERWAGPGTLRRTYVTTSTAAGEPAACDVEVRWRSVGGGELELARFKTDSYGIGRFESGQDLDELEGGELEDGELVFLASDAAGLTGEAVHYPWYDDSERIFVDSPRTLHRPGEPLAVTLQTAEPVSDVVVEVRRGVHLLRERRLSRLEAAQPVPLVFEPGHDLSGRIDVVAYSLTPQDPYAGFTAGRRRLLYPHGRDLKLALSVREEPYRPGEKARFRVRSSTPGVLGLAVTHASLEALQERRGFDRRPALLPNRLRAEEEYAGWTVTRLLELGADEEWPEELDQLADLLVRHDDGYVATDLSTPIGEELREHAAFFKAQFKDKGRLLEEALDRPQLTTPQGPETLVPLLDEAGFGLEGLADPWGKPYRPALTASADKWRFTLRSAGRDNAWDSLDDFTAWSRTWSYARRLGEAVEKQLHLEYLQNGSFPGEAGVLVDRLKAAGIDWARQRDPWDRPYCLRVRPISGSTFELRLASDGPDKKPETKDDVVAWIRNLNVALVLRHVVRQALSAYWDRHESYPAGDAEMRAALRHAGQDPDRWKDLAGRPFLSFQRAERSDFIDRLFVEPGGTTRLEPTEVTTVHYRIWSTGPDRKLGTEDDADLGSVGAPMPMSWDESQITGPSGLLRGRVSDWEGLILPGASVYLLDGAGRQHAIVVSNAAGRFDLVVPAGMYTLRAELDGFSTVEYPFVEIQAGRGVGLDVVLHPAIVEYITVTSESPPLRAALRTSAAPEPIRTQRIRRDFRETLLWLGELATDEEGHAEVAFDLDDSIATWRVAAIASTLDGRVASATDEIVATLPFRTELDLPSVVTAGDEIAVPVYLRNRTATSREVEVRSQRLERAETASRPQTVALEAGGVRRLDLEQRFDEPGEAVLAVTAAGAGAADGVERRTRVRPDGREIVEVRARLVAGVRDLELDVPAGALPGTGQLELRLMDRLSDHLVAAIEGLARRPVGCAEQTLSTAWANALWWRAMDAVGENDSEKRRRAQQHMEIGRDALVHFQNPKGGIAYWSYGKADVALTGYALEYLREVDGLIAVDPELSSSLASWLRDEQDEDGAWRHRRPHWATGLEPDGASPLDVRITAWIARILASDENHEAVRRALAFLNEHRLANDPYTLANVVMAKQALVAAEGGEPPLKERAELIAMARDLEGAAYWDLESNTPFYGWGHAGRVETTAIAVRALAAGDPASEVIERGSAFLLLHKDSDGLWASTQATVQVLRALATVLPSSPASSAPPKMTLDGAEVSLAPGTHPTFPLSPGAHHLRIESSEDSDWRIVEARVRHYVPWSRDDGEEPPEDLFFKVSCNPKDGMNVGRPVDCAVEAGRRRFRGYGMLIAEVGLPPGAEVDRESLELALRDGHVQRYEVWPDRVVTYLWPRAGGTRFDLRWYPRLAMRARSAPSSLYDYYSPSARVVLAPDEYRIE